MSDNKQSDEVRCACTDDEICLFHGIETVGSSSTGSGIAGRPAHLRMPSTDALAWAKTRERRGPGYVYQLALDLDAFAAERVNEERARIAERVSERRILRLSVGVDPLEEANSIIQDLAHDIETNWSDYEDEE